MWEAIDTRCETVEGALETDEERVYVVDGMNSRMNSIWPLEILEKAISTTWYCWRPYSMYVYVGKDVNCTLSCSNSHYLCDDHVIVYPDYMPVHERHMYKVRNSRYNIIVESLCFNIFTDNIENIQVYL